MSRLLFKHMASKGCTSAVLLNRSLPRALALAEEFPEVLARIFIAPDVEPNNAGCRCWQMLAGIRPALDSAGL